MFEILTDGEIRAISISSTEATFRAADALIAAAKRRSMDGLAGMKMLSPLTDVVLKQPHLSAEDLVIQAEQLLTQDVAP